MEKNKKSWDERSKKLKFILTNWEYMNTSFLKKHGLFFISFAFVFAVLSACGDSSSTSSSENDFLPLDEDFFESTESSSSENDEVSSSSERIKASSSSVSSSSKKVKVSSSSEVSSSEISSGETTSTEKVNVSSSSEKNFESSSSVVQTRSSSSSLIRLSSSSYFSSSSIDIFAHSSSSFAIVPLDTLEDECDLEGSTRYYMVGKKQKVYEICHNGKWVEMNSSSSSAVNTHIVMDGLFNPNISYGIIKDERDGQFYKTVVIEKERKIEYFAQNLNYGKQIMATETEFDDSVVEKYCYNDDSWFCENGWGGLYTWSEAMGLPSACNSVRMGSTAECPDSIATGTKASSWDSLQIQGICPNGWHILNKSEWEMLVYGNPGSYYSRDLLSRIYGNEDDDGFSLLPAGLLNVARYVEYQMMPERGYLWLTEECGENCAPAIIFDLVNWIENDNHRLKGTGMSIRCVKNYTAQ